MKRRREFWILEHMFGPEISSDIEDHRASAWRVPIAQEKGVIHVRECLPGEDEMIQELVRAAEETLANTKGLTAKGDIPLIRALDKYKKWESGE